jgi:hypothetical protein
MKAIPVSEGRWLSRLYAVHILGWTLVTEGVAFDVYNNGFCQFVNSVDLTEGMDRKEVMKSISGAAPRRSCKPSTLF